MSFNGNRIGMAYVIIADEYLEFVTNLQRGDEGLEKSLLSCIEKWRLGNRKNQLPFEAFTSIKTFGHRR